MHIHAIGDPHLALATPGKDMDRFGEQWIRHPEQIAAACRATVAEDDLLLIPGDISAQKLPAAQADLDFLGTLPGTKVLIRGNHDYWWQSISKVRAALPQRMHALQADAIDHHGIHLAGTRLWDVPGTQFGHLIDWNRDEQGQAISAPPLSEAEIAQSEKIYRRELGRLRRAIEALDALPGPARLRILMLHYPPCQADLAPTEVTELIEQAGIDHVVFGHIHSLKPDLPPLFGTRGRTHYHLVSCDYLGFRPKQIA